MATSDVMVIGACVTLVDFGVGDHILFIIDFLTASLVGSNPSRIMWSKAKKLNTCQVAKAKRYYNNFRENILRHRLVERLGKAHEETTCPVLLRKRSTRLIKRVSSTWCTQRPNSVKLSQAEFHSHQSLQFGSSEYKSTVLFSIYTQRRSATKEIQSELQENAESTRQCTCFSQKLRNVSEFADPNVNSYVAMARIIEENF